MSRLPEKFIAGDEWDNEIFKVVGKITIAFAQLDHLLLLISKRLKRKSLKKLSAGEWKELTKARFIPDRCKQIRARAMAMDQNRRTELESLLHEVECISTERNSVTHGQWGYKKI